MKMENVGVITPELEHCYKAMFVQFPFLGWSPKYSADLLGNFQKEFPCHCSSHDECIETWERDKHQRFQAALPIAPLLPPSSPQQPAIYNPNYGVPTSPQKKSTQSAASPSTPVGAFSPNAVVPTSPQKAASQNGAAPSSPVAMFSWQKAASQNGAAPSTPVGMPTRKDVDTTPPRSQTPNEMRKRLRSICDKTGSPDPKRLHAVCENNESDEKKPAGDECAVVASKAEEHEVMSEDEQNRFSTILHNGLNEVLAVLEDVTHDLISKKQWGNLQQLDTCVEQVRKYVEANECSSLSKEMADKIIEELYDKCNISPKLSTCQEVLASWNDKPQTKSLYCVMEQFLEGWTREWPKITPELVKEKKWTVLEQLQDSKTQLEGLLKTSNESTMSDRDQGKAYLENLKGMGYFGRVPELDEALATLVCN